MCTLYTFEWHLQEWSFHIQGLQAHTGKGCTQAHTELHSCLSSRSQYHHSMTTPALSLLASTLLYSTTNCTYTESKKEFYSESTYICGKFICWNNLSLFCCHLQEILFVDLEEPPALLGGQIRGAPSLVEPDGGLVPLCHQEVHAAAAALHSHLQSQGHTVTVWGQPQGQPMALLINCVPPQVIEFIPLPLQHFSVYQALGNVLSCLESLPPPLILVQT